MLFSPNQQRKYHHQFQHQLLHNTCKIHPQSPFHPIHTYPIDLKTLLKSNPLIFSLIYTLKKKNNFIINMIE